MNFVIATIMLVLIIIASYLADRKYPRKRIYIIPTGVILLCSVLLYISWLTPPTQKPISEQQRIDILKEQPYFITWYNSHKETITQIDRYISSYHKIIDSYKKDEITAQEASERLQTLYADSSNFDKSLQTQLPPTELSQNNYTLVYNILEKTRVYSYKINEVTRQSINVINEGVENDFDKPSIVNNLTRIYLLQGPVNLDINGDVVQLKDNLTIDE